MPFAIPSLGELAQRTANAFRADLKGSDARLWPNNVAVAAKVIAGAIYEWFSFLDYISRQHIKHLAEGVWLERHAFDYGLARLPATFAQGTVTLNGDAAIVVPSGLGIQRADGVRYTSTSGGTTDGDGEVTVQVRCNVAGSIGNALPGVLMTLTAPVSRMNSEGEVGEAGIGLGSDFESDEALRERLLHRLRMPPHGGAAHDYVAWAREVNGVTRVFVDPVTMDNGRSNVGVWFLMDNLYENGIPQSADVSQVAAYINTVRPAGAVIVVAAPTPVSVNITIDNMDDDSTATRNAIAAELTALFARHSRVSTLTDPFTLYPSVISEVISQAVGEIHHELTAPAAPVAYAAGQIPVLGTINYT
jgi:uncharacterized phage protein gp47/JayE